MADTFTSPSTKPTTMSYSDSSNSRDNLWRLLKTQRGYPPQNDDTELELAAKAAWNLQTQKAVPVDLSGYATLTGTETLENKTLAGYTQTLTDRIDYQTLVGTEIDFSWAGHVYSATGDSSLTFSAGTPLAGVRTRLKIVADGTDRTIGIPTAFSIARNAEVSSVVVPAGGQVALLFEYTGTRWEVFGDPVSDDLKTYNVGFTADGGGSAIATGKVKGFGTAKASGTIRAWTHTVDTGTPVIKVWKIAAGTAKPTAANAINTSGVGVSSGTHVRSSTLTDFTSTTVTQGDVFAFNIESNTGSATEMSFGLEIVIS